MRRAAATILLLLISASCNNLRPGDPPRAAPSLAARVSPSPSPTPPPLAFSTDRAMEHTRVLSVDIGRRPAGSEGETRAADYIEGAFGTARLEVGRGEVKRADGGVSFNVIGRIPSVDYGGGYVVIGGHYDTVPASPGGNDNGSGTGTVMALAEAFAKRKAPVEFVAFAAEEIQRRTREHHVGSRAYAAALADPSLVRAMISIDMVGSGPQLIIALYRGSSDALQKELLEVGRSLGMPVSSTVRGDLSDHGPFARRGVASAWLWSGDHQTLHTAGDVFEVVQRDSVERTGRVMLEWLKMRFSLT